MPSRPRPWADTQKERMRGRLQWRRKGGNGGGCNMDYLGKYTPQWTANSGYTEAAKTEVFRSSPGGSSGRSPCSPCSAFPWPQRYSLEVPHGKPTAWQAPGFLIRRCEFGSLSPPKDLQEAMLPFPNRLMRNQTVTPYSSHGAVCDAGA